MNTDPTPPDTADNAPLTWLRCVELAEYHARQAVLHNGHYSTQHAPIVTALCALAPLLSERDTYLSETRDR